MPITFNEGLPARRFERVRNTAKMGTVFELPDPGASVWLPPDNDGVPAVLANHQALTLDPSVMGENLAPGSWVISLNTALKVPNYSNNPFCGNVIAKIDWGAGGSLFTAYVDAWSQIVAIPADNVTVTIISESVGSDLSGAPQVGAYWTSAYLCSVGAVRSFDSKPRLATRSYPVFFDGLGGTNRAVPPFAVSANFRAYQSPPAGTPPLTGLKYYGGPDFLVDQAVIETLSRMNQMIDIPQGSRRVTGTFPWIPSLRGAFQFAIEV